MTTGRDGLVAFLHEQNAKGPAATPSPENLHKEWIRALKRLFHEVREWLKPVEAEGLRVTAAEVSVDEGAGPYQAPALQIQFQDRRVDLMPIARHIMGASGRVDMIRGTNRRVLARFAPSEWHVVRRASPDTEWESTPLTADSLADSLREMLA